MESKKMTTKEVVKNKIVVNETSGGFGISEAGLKWLAERGVDAARFYPSRHNKVLVAMVEALGSEASGKYADLQIEEIEGHLYRIEEYDGYERVEVPSKSMWEDTRED